MTLLRALAWSVTVAALPALAAADWSTAVGGSSERHGRSPVAGPTSPDLLWGVSRPSLWGENSVAAGNLLVVTRIVNHAAPEGGLIVAHDLQSGQELWAAQLPVDPDSSRAARVSAIRDGQVYATRSGDLADEDYLYALDAATGAVRWRSQDRIGEGRSESLAFTSGGDLIVGSLFTIKRIRRADGTTLWTSQRFGPSSDGCAAVVHKDRIYIWENRNGGARVTVFDAAGSRLYSSPVIGLPCSACAQQTSLFAGPDGTIYAPRTTTGEVLVALRDTGSAFEVKWSAPLGYVPFATFAVGPDGSVYSYSADNRVLRLDPATGSVRNQSAPLTAHAFFWPRMTADVLGRLFVSTGTDQGLLYSLEADLTPRWLTSAPGALFGGPVLADNGVLVQGMSGDRVFAYWTPTTAWAVRGVGDLDGDAFTDLVWQSEDGRLAAWLMNGTDRVRGRFVDPPYPGDGQWAVAGQGDFNRDGKADLLWRHGGSGEIVVWHMDGERLTAAAFTTPPVLADPAWTIAGTGQFDGDGKVDILWRHVLSGQLAVWYMDGLTLASGTFTSPPGLSDLGWRIEATGDFNQDARTDLVWRHQASGETVLWYMNGATLASGTYTDPPAVSDTRWGIAGAADFNGDGHTDLLWRHRDAGEHVVWLMNGASLTGGAALSPSRFGLGPDP
jgi:outer membrane protein assembly factor BamB